MILIVSSLGESRCLKSMLKLYSDRKLKKPYGEFIEKLELVEEKIYRDQDG